MKLKTADMVPSENEGGKGGEMGQSKVPETRPLSIKADRLSAKQKTTKKGGNRVPKHNWATSSFGTGTFDAGEKKRPCCPRWNPPPLVPARTFTSETAPWASSSGPSGTRTGGGCSRGRSATTPSLRGGRGPRPACPRWVNTTGWILFVLGRCRQK